VAIAERRGADDLVDDGELASGSRRHALLKRETRGNEDIHTVCTYEVVGKSFSFIQKGYEKTKKMAAAEGVQIRWMSMQHTCK
jgi:hypothetical protein